MREKIRDLSVAKIPDTEFSIRIEFWNRYGKAYEHIERYNEYCAVIFETDTGGECWDLGDLNGVTLEHAQHDVELLAEVFGFEGKLDWQAM